MAMFHAIKQLEEKNVANEINFMVWSDRMDLVAISNIKGEVALHRLTWTRAWTLGPPKEGLTVKGLCWRPDGKIIAIAYSSGEIYLISVENKSALYIVDTQCDITCVHWIQEKVDIKTTESPLNQDCAEQQDYMKHIDYSSVFLYEPPSTTYTSPASTEEIQKQENILHKQSELNLLVTGTKEGIVHISVFGCYPCASIDLKQLVGYPCSIENVHLTENLSKMFVTIRDTGDNIKVVMLNSALLQTHTKELFAVALKQVRLYDLVNYISNTISIIKETWENILLEMDNKLSKYASKVAEGGVTADFLDLLMFGLCSTEMQEFLITDLTKKGLEKFGQTIEMSYSNIQKLMLKYIIKYGQNITYHLAELRGMARMELRYDIFGLSEETITEAIHSVGLFLIKSGEMQQIINHSVINYKAFFRWLYTAIMQLMQEQISPDIPKMTQQDLAYITEFLQNFDHIGCKNEENKRHFIMERVGQYLVDSPLTISPNMEGNDWTKFVDGSDCLKNDTNILKHFKDMSLIQQYKHLKTSVDEIFIKPKDTFSKQFTVIKSFECFKNTGKLNMSQININNEVSLFAFLHEREKLDLFQIHTSNINSSRYARFYFSQFLSYEQESFGDNYQLLQAKFYSTSILSLLLEETTTSKLGVLFQFSIPLALEKLQEINVESEIVSTNIIQEVNGSNLVPKLFKNIEGMFVSQFAVSGSRRVSIVLSENKRKVKLFEMEGEEEDDEDADMTNSTVKEGDSTMHDSSLME